MYELIIYILYLYSRYTVTVYQLDDNCDDKQQNTLHYFINLFYLFIYLFIYLF